MENILSKIIAATLLRVSEDKLIVSEEAMRSAAEGMPRTDGGAKFAAALRKPGMSFICEVKRASPSKGIIAEDFDPVAVAAEYTAAGADAISVLTERDFFLGSPEYLKLISTVVPTPLLRKDFIVDEYQIYEARRLGASAVLLICAVLEDAALCRFIKTARSLGLACLVETRDGREIDRALSAGAEIVGVNNRDLKTFEVNLKTSIKLRPLVPKNVLFVSESGISKREDVAALEVAGVDAVLIGESLMRSPNKAAYLQYLKGAT